MQEKLFCKENSLENETCINDEKLFSQHKQNIPEYIIKELSNIIQNYSHYQTPQMNQIDFAHYKHLNQKDQESFQTQYFIQKYPGNIKEAKEKAKNMTIKQIYLNKRSENLDWLYTNIYQEKYILEKYGLGVPLLFSQIKLIITVLYVLFFINMYDGFQQINECQQPQGCDSPILGGIAVIDIIMLPNAFMSSTSFAIWIIFSFFLNIYIQNISEQQNEFKSHRMNQGDQIILKYFKKDLNQQKIEQILNKKLYNFCDRKKIEYPQQFQIQVKSVIPINNVYKINQQIQKINIIYMNIIKQINDNHLPILQSNQSNKIDSQQKQLKIHNQNQTVKRFDTQRSSLKTMNKQEEKKQVKSFSINKEDKSTSYDNQNSQIQDQDELELIKVRCQQYLKHNDKSVNTLVKLIKQYHNEKQILQELSQPNNTHSFSYILICQNTQQKDMIQNILKPSNSIVSYFQKCRYLLRNQESDYTLNRMEMSKSVDENVNWNTIGFGYQSRFLRQFYVRVFATLQFLLSFLVSLFIYTYSMHSQLEDSSLSVTMYLLLLAISQSLFYLINYQIFELYSKCLVASFKSKRIQLQMSNFFFLYSLSYILFPFITVFVFWFIGDSSQSYKQQNNLFYQFHKSPFKLFIMNYLIACCVFSLKSYIPVKWVKAVFEQWFYSRSQRFLKKTQYELNKIYKRSKFRLQDSSISTFSILLISIPITFCFPLLVIFPILLLHIQYFAFKYHYLVLLRPTYYCKSIQIKTSMQLATYIQRITFISALFFSPDIPYFLSIVTFYIFVSMYQICEKIYNKFNYSVEKVSDQKFLNCLENLKNIQNRQIQNQLLLSAVQSHQTSYQFMDNQYSQNGSKTSYFDESNNENTSKLSTQNDIKNQLYSYEQSYSKHKQIIEDITKFHCNQL